MRRRIVVASLAIAAGIVAACSDVQVPTAPQVDGSALTLTINANGCVDQVNLSDLTAVDTEVKSLITGLFGDQNQRSSTLSMWENLKKDKLESRPLLNHIDNLTKWTLEHYYAGTLSAPRADLNPTTGSMRLLDLVFRCTGETPSQVPTPPAGIDAIISLVKPSTADQKFVTPENEVLAVIPGNSLLEPTVLALVKQPETVIINSPFPKVSDIVDVALAGGRPKNANLSVVFCPHHDVSDDRTPGIVVAHQRKTPTATVGENVDYLKRSTEQHECEPQGGLAFNPSAAKNPLKRGLLHFASMATKALRLASPKKLYAAHAGIGGLIAFDADGAGDLSPMVLVDTRVETEIVIAEIGQTTYGEDVIVDAQLKVKSIPDGHCNDSPAPDPLPIACEWEGEPLTQSLRGMPTLVLDSLRIGAMLQQSNQVQAIDNQGKVKFTFTHLNAGADQVARLRFRSTINVPANAPSFSMSNAEALYTILPRPLTVTAIDHSWVYGSSTTVPDGEFSDGAVQYSDVVTPKFTTEASDTTQAGPYPGAVKADVVFVAPTLASNYVVTKTNADLLITKASLTVTANPKSREYGIETVFDLNKPSTDGAVDGIKNDDDYTLTFSTNAVTGSEITEFAAVPYTITPAVSGDRLVRNYNIAINPATLTITRAPIDISIHDSERLYGQANSEVVPEFAHDPFPARNNDVLTLEFATPATMTSPVGPYNILGRLRGDRARNYVVITKKAGVLTVKPRPLTVTVGSHTRVYGDPIDITPTTNAVNGDAFTYTFTPNIDGIVNVGTDMPLTATINGPTPNYSPINYVAGTLTITPRPLTVTVGSHTRVYGEAINIRPTTNAVNAADDNSFSYTFAPSLDGLVNVVTNMPVSVTISGAAPNYSPVTYEPGTLTVTPKPLTGTIGDASKTQGAPNPNLDEVVPATVSGIVAGSGYAVKLSTTASTESPVGAYPITLDLTGAGGSNYTWTGTNGTLTVNAAAPAGPTITSLVLSSASVSIENSTTSYTAVLNNPGATASPSWTLQGTITQGAITQASGGTGTNCPGSTFDYLPSGNCTQSSSISGKTLFSNQLVAGPAVFKLELIHNGVVVASRTMDITMVP